MTQDQLKQAVAQAAVDFILPKLDDKSIVGVGTGSTANCFIDALARHKGAFDGAVASSEATAARLKGHGIPVYELNTVSDLEFYIDGADESDAQLNLIKGGGAALTRDDPDGPQPRGASVGEVGRRPGVSRRRADR